MRRFAGLLATIDAVLFPLAIIQAFQSKGDNSFQTVVVPSIFFATINIIILFQFLQLLKERKARVKVKFIMFTLMGTHFLSALLTVISIFMVNNQILFHINTLKFFCTEVYIFTYLYLMFKMIILNKMGDNLYGYSYWYITSTIINCLCFSQITLMFFPPNIQQFLFGFGLFLGCISSFTMGLILLKSSQEV